jgi:hypothetical protein
LRLSFSCHSKGDDFLVLASDGLWDVLKGFQVANAVRRFKVQHQERANDAAAAARRAARAAAAAAAAGAAAVGAGAGAGVGAGRSSASSPARPESTAGVGAAGAGAGAGAAGAAPPLDLTALAEELVQLALRLGSADNITVAVVAFEYD